MEVGEDELQGLYTWVDTIPLSRPKRSIARDFADGVLVAEIVAYYFPRAVELHNYSAASSITQKMYNWNTLNQKVLRKFKVNGTKAEFEAICNCVPGAIEKFLKTLRVKLAKQSKTGLHQVEAQPTAQWSNGSQGPIAAAAPPARHSDIPPIQHNHQRQQHQIQEEHYQQHNRHQQHHEAPSGAAVSQVPAEVTNGQVVVQLPEHTQRMMERAGEGIGERLAEAAKEIMNRDMTIAELGKINDILEEKVRKLEKLVRVKDVKIQTLSAKLQAVEDR